MKRDFWNSGFTIEGNPFFINPICSFGQSDENRNIVKQSNCSYYTVIILKERWRYSKIKAVYVNYSEEKGAGTLPEMSDRDGEIRDGWI